LVLGLRSNKIRAVIKADGRTERYRRSKLTNSLKKCGVSYKQANNIAKNIERKFSKSAVISSIDLYNETKLQLTANINDTAIRYSLKRGLFDLGPTGFPFEKLIHKLFFKMGYQVIGNGSISGKCIQHEIDLIARMDNVEHWAECKFHHTQGIICDAKTALYVMGRYVDLSDHSINHRPNRMWLITNTRFSKDALQLLQCRQMNALSWDYPIGNGLKDLLERHEILLVTCIPNLKRSQVRELLDMGIVTIDDIKELNIQSLSKLLSPKTLHVIKNFITNSRL
jgi:hypothetical protein